MMTSAPHPETWLKPVPGGLYCVPGDFFIDPTRRADRAIITHGHSDHARADNGAVLATAETIAIMRHRLGERAGGSHQALAYGETIRMGEVAVRLVPAGHVLGSAQVVMDWRGSRAVVSGDYKRRRDPTCAPFEPVPCDVFVTEATFGLPVFRHPPDTEEIDKLLHALRLFPERCALVGVYSLGKAQRVLALIRAAGHAAPIYLHGAITNICAIYESFGQSFGDVRPMLNLPKDDLKTHIILAPPGVTADVWARRLPDPIVAMASGWMRVKQRAKQRGVELPLVISDHADWDELMQTFDDVAAPEIWVTHGAEEALIRQATLTGRRARALRLVGLGEEEAE
jgi:putative mRNA 3-end processing factor